MKIKLFKSIIKKLQVVKNKDKYIPSYDYMQIDGDKYILSSKDHQLTIKGEQVNGLTEPIKVDFELFAKIINKTTSADIVLSYENNTLIINGKHKIPAKSEYILTFDLGNVYLPQTQLTERTKQAIIKAVNFVSDYQLRPIMQGIYFNGKDVVSTNAHYLYKCTDLGNEFADYNSYIMPISVAKFIDEANTIEMRDDNVIVVEGNGFKYICRNIEGKYPNYNAVIPKENKYTTIVNKKELLNELQESKISGNGYKNIYTIFDNGVIIDSLNVYYDTSFNSSIGSIDGNNNIKISLMNNYLETILKHYEPEQLNIQYNDNKMPIVFNDKDETFMLMPCNID